MDELVGPIRLVHLTTVPESLSFLTAQVSFMRSRGVEVHAISSPGAYLDEFGRREGIQVHPVAMPRAITPIHDLASIREIVREIRRIRPRIVHAHTPKAGLLGMISARIAGVPVRVYHIHGLPFMTATGLKRRLLTMSERTSSRLATQVLCVSNSVRDVVVKDGLCPADKVKVLLGGSINGVDADFTFNPERIGDETRRQVRERFGIPGDGVVMGFTGRLVRDKGVVELVRAWQMLRDGHPELHLLVVGTPEPRDPVPAEVDAVMRNDDRIHMAGLQMDMPPVYKAMDMVVLPTYREGFPLVPMEAASMGLPVIATLVPGCVDAVDDGVTGTLVPPRDADALARAIEVYITHPELRKARGLAGRERMLWEFRREDMWDAVLGEYGRLIEASGSEGEVYAQARS